LLRRKDKWEPPPQPEINFDKPKSNLIPKTISGMQ
jgi:hypothetical protein